jgi:AhpD family alkylhydroperoxidase
MHQHAERIKLVERSDVTGSDAIAYDKIARDRGSMGNIFKALANSAGALESVAAVGTFLRRTASIDERLRELITLIVASEQRCEYIWTGHARVALALGLDPSSIADPAADQRATDATGVLVMQYARLVASGTPVPDDLHREVRSAVGDAVLVEITVLIGYYTMLATVIRALAVPLEQGVEPVPLP